VTVPAGLAQQSSPVGLGIASAGVHALSSPDAPWPADFGGNAVSCCQLGWVV